MILRMPNTERPAYDQVKEWIRQHTASGEWRPGDVVPSQAVLMSRFSISRMTANRALRELAAEGLVTRVQGSGTRVAQLHRISSQLVIRDIHEEVVGRGNGVPIVYEDRYVNPSMMRRTVSGPHVASVARQVYPGTRYGFSGQFQA
jgi:DNA-binding GntR family transcriptional regulator